MGIASYISNSLFLTIVSLQLLKSHTFIYAVVGRVHEKKDFSSLNCSSPTFYLPRPLLSVVALHLQIAHLSVMNMHRAANTGGDS